MSRINRRDFILASASSAFLGATPALPFSADASQVAGPQPGQGARPAYPGGPAANWTIANSLVSRKLAFSAGTGLYTASWRHQVTGTDFVEAPRERRIRGAEFSIQVGAARLRGTDPSAWELLEAKTQAFGPHGQLLSIHLRSVAHPIDATAFYAVYDGHPVVQKWMAIANRGDQPLLLSHFAFESAGIAPGPPHLLEASSFDGAQPREIFFTGRVDDAAVLLKNSMTGEGLLAMNGAPGWTKRTELTGWGYGVTLMYDTDLFPFERTLAPGETFTSARGAIAFFVDGKGLSDPRWVVPSYTSGILMKKGPGNRPPWIYNTWEPFERSITEPIARDLITAAGRMGMDIFTIDDGWQADYGSNAVNRTLFPNGLDEIQAAVEQHGMRLGLWAPLAAVSTEAEVYQQHPDWVCRDRDGNPKFTGTMAGSQAVMCLASPYREAAAKRISELVGRYRLRYVKLDLTSVFNAYGEAPGCFARNHDHRSWAESLIRIYEGIQYVTDAVYRDHPEVLLDITFELWGEKHLIDYGLLAAGDLDWMSNVDDGNPASAGPLQARTLLYQRSLAVPSETMLIGNLQAEMPTLEERLATAMGSAPLFLGDLRRLTAERQAFCREKIQWFNALRNQIPMLQGFFPLGGWRQPGANDWDGYARLSHAGEGLIAVFRNESKRSAVEVALPVFPDGAFSLRSGITGSALQNCTGAQLRQGIQIAFPAGSPAELVAVRRVDKQQVPSNK